MDDRGTRLGFGIVPDGQSGEPAEPSAEQPAAPAPQTMPGSAPAPGHVRAPLPAPHRSHSPSTAPSSSPGSPPGSPPVSTVQGYHASQIPGATQPAPSAPSTSAPVASPYAPPASPYAPPASPYAPPSAAPPSSSSPYESPSPAHEPAFVAGRPPGPPAPLVTAQLTPEMAMGAIKVPMGERPIEALSSHFLAISLRRAFRLQINVQEVLPGERVHLESNASHVRDPDQQAFLAWRRSVLLLVAIMFVPLTVFRFIEAFDGPPLPTVGRIFTLLPAIAEGAFCLIAFDQLKNWAQWKRQRRILFLAWALYFVAPFIVYVYPFRSVFDDHIGNLPAPTIGGVSFRVSTEQAHFLVGLAAGVQAMMALGPKVISLMPGMIRASIVTKLLFPGTTAPGWLMLLAAPFYALFAYIIVLFPYQITGSWQFIVGNTGILFAQVFIGISGRRLTVPLSAVESHHRIHRNWLIYIGILVLSAMFMVYGLYDFIHELHLGKVRVVTGVLAFISNVLLDTLIGTDAIVSAMAYFRKRAHVDESHEQLMRDSEVKLEIFTT